MQRLDIFSYLASRLCPRICRQLTMEVALLPGHNHATEDNVHWWCCQSGERTVKRYNTLKPLQTKALSTRRWVFLKRCFFSRPPVLNFFLKNRKKSKIILDNLVHTWVVWAMSSKHRSKMSYRPIRNLKKSQRFDWVRHRNIKLTQALCFVASSDASLPLLVCSSRCYLKILTLERIFQNAAVLVS